MKTNQFVLGAEGEKSYYTSVWWDFFPIVFKDGIISI